MIFLYIKARICLAPNPFHCSYRVTRVKEMLIIHYKDAEISAKYSVLQY